MHWIGRSIVLLALLVIAAAIFWPDAWRAGSGNIPNKPLAEAESSGQTVPGFVSDAESMTADDNPHVSDMKNPLTRALDGMLASHGEVFKDSEDGLRDRIEDADRRLSGVKSDIRSAMRNANRQVRVPGQNSPLVMLVVLEGVAKDELGFYGEPGKTPLLEALAEQGTVFESCYAGPTVDIARHMLMTGSGFSKGKARSNQIAEMMWNSGYRALLVEDANWMSEYERHQYDEDVSAKVDPTTGLPVKLVFNGAEAKIVANQNEDSDDDISSTDLLVGQSRELLLKRPSNRPVYVEYHFSVTTDDPEARATQIAEIDQSIGRLFHSMHTARSGRSMVMVVTGLPPAKQPQNEGILSESNLQVPLMIYRSHKNNVAKIEEPCGLLDVLPTLAGMITSSRVPRHNGISLQPWMDGKPTSTRRFRWTNPSDEDQFAIRQGPWKAIFGASDQLFFLPDDPRETNNVAAQHPQVLQGLSGSSPNRTKMNF
ncbi:sulfatase-like hydrolase/transferase [Bremerella sp. P1]|uniref:sulfatase-like hydrolase/transferase n=1 Tax=Bremerella sp. P1 TaxID=3026424 RepID=UPI0023679D56|nr:sulfatase-like hydrolase/transferase [Bremerella sp. P1]WDI40801.1 sulfatase-like hydrolase/transferase [Bremerella sp. P1]